MNSWVTQFMAAITPYMIMLASSVFIVATATVYNWGRTRGLADQIKQLNGGGGKTTVVMPQQQTVGGGTRLLRAPVWNQLDDVLPDNLQDPYATTDCGEESVAMTIAACGGPSLPAGVLRQCLGGPLRQGLTSAADLVYLLKLFRLPAHVRFCPGNVAYQEWQHSFKAGYLVIALGWWVTDGYPHWVLIRGITDASITFNDPWGGEVKTMLKGDVMVKYKGEYVHVDSGVTDPAPEEVASA